MIIIILLSRKASCIRRGVGVSGWGVLWKCQFRVDDITDGAVRSSRKASFRLIYRKILETRSTIVFFWQRYHTTKSSFCWVPGRSSWIESCVDGILVWVQRVQLTVVTVRAEIAQGGDKTTMLLEEKKRKDLVSNVSNSILTIIFMSIISRGQGVSCWQNFPLPCLLLASSTCLFESLGWDKTLWLPSCRSEWHIHNYLREQTLLCCVTWGLNRCFSTVSLWFKK